MYAIKNTEIAKPNNEIIQELESKDLSFYSPLITQISTKIYVFSRI